MRGRIGDMDIDMGPAGVRAHGDRAASGPTHGDRRADASGPDDRAAPRVGSSLAILDPRRARTLALFSVGFATLALVAAWTLVPAPFDVVAGVAAALALVQGAPLFALARRRARTSREAREALRTQRADAMRTHLADAEPARCTVTSIASALSWPEDDVVDALADLVRQGAVAEDLTESGEWVYALDRSAPIADADALAPAALPVLARAAQRRDP